MISQPDVANGSGRTQLLDEQLGVGFTLLGYNCDPAQEIQESALAPWREWGLKVAAVRDDGVAGDLSMAPGSHLAELFETGGTNMVLLRPDHFCMAAFNAASATNTLEQAAGMLGLQSR